LAVVAGDLIMMSDVAAARDLGLVPLGKGSDPIREVLSRLIDRALMLDEVERYAPPEPVAADIDRELSTVRSRFASPAAFEMELMRLGINEAHVREILRQDMRLRAYLD